VKNCVIIIICVDAEVDESVLTEGIMYVCDSVSVGMECSLHRDE